MGCFNLCGGSQKDNQAPWYAGNQPQMGGYSNNVLKFASTVTLPSEETETKVINQEPAPASIEGKVERKAERKLERTGGKKEDKKVCIEYPLGLPKKSGSYKALLIGISYKCTEMELLCAENDLDKMADLLFKRYNFDRSDIVILSCREQDNGSPTRDNIMQAIKWLTKDAVANDSLFFFCTSQGGQMKDEDGDELDGKDEFIYPLDYQTRAPITDDELRKALVEPLPLNAKLTAFIDCCNAGTMLDLTYSYTDKGKRNAASNVKQEAKANVVLFASCQDAECATLTYDTKEGPLGLLAKTVTEILGANITEKPISYLQFYTSLINKMKSANQIPLMTTSKVLDTTTKFSLTN